MRTMNPIRILALVLLLLSLEQPTYVLGKPGRLNI